MHTPDSGIDGEIKQTGPFGFPIPQEERRTAKNGHRNADWSNVQNQVANKLLLEPSCAVLPTSTRGVSILVSSSGVGWP